MKREEWRERQDAREAGESDAAEAAAGRVERLAAALRDPDLPQAARLRVLAAARARREPPGATPEVMTPDELAGFLRVAPEELDEVIADIPGFEVAGRLRFRRERVEAWMAERERLRENEILFGRLSEDRLLGTTPRTAL